jgi:hypothetical protein
MRHGSDERIAVTSAIASMLAALTLSPLVSGVGWLFVAAITVVTMMVTGIIARQLVRWWPAVNSVTMISSNDSAKASIPPASSAVAICGSSTKRKVCRLFAPRSIEASTQLFGSLRSRATTLL